jgi:hypothetical protein
MHNAASIAQHRFGWLFPETVKPLMRAVQGMLGFGLIHLDKCVDLVFDDRQLNWNVSQHCISSCGLPQHRLI